MNPRASRNLRLAALAAVGAIVATVSAAPAYAADGDVKVVNTETVQVYTSPTGQVQTRRVYEQLALTGNGPVDVKNPISTDHLRNLDGFGGFDVKGGDQITRTTVDGEKKLRSVSDFTGTLPLKVSVAYTLDGKNVQPGDIVGKDGRLGVQYTVENVTGAPQDVSFPDGKGGTVTKSVDVPIPMVGSLTTVAPPAFTNVRSKQANLAGDGKGGTQMSFTMTLFPPIGSTTAVFGYTADVQDAVVPRANVSALPVNPLESPTFKTAATSYQGGADTGAELTDGAGKIDTNLLKLRDGASSLLAGLIKLREGAGQLNTGLAGDAVPGSRKLANGAGDLSAGLLKIDDGGSRLALGTGKVSAGASKLSAGIDQTAAGADKLATGAGTLAGGTGDALAGSQKITGGLAQVSGGLGELADATTGLPKAKAGIVRLQNGVDQILTGLGDPTDPTTLIGGLTKLVASFGDDANAQTLIGGSARIEGGLRQLRGDGSQTPAGGIAGARNVVGAVQGGLGATVAAGGRLDQLIGGLTALRDTIPACTSDPTCKGTANALLTGATSSKTDLSQANGALLAVSAGLGNAVQALDGLLIPGAAQLHAGLGQAKTGASDLTAGAQQAKGGLLQVSAGLDDLATGVTKAVTGIDKLSGGASTLYAGSSDLSDGLVRIDGGATRLAAGNGRLAAGTTGKLNPGGVKLASGAQELFAGATKLADGTGTASDGSGKLAAGADKLSGGLQDAADGSGKIADGLTTATGGTPKLVNGAQDLSDKGTQKLVGAGTSTAQSYGELYATMVAGSERAQNEDMAFGAPADAVGLTAYSYVINGDDGEGGRNLARGLAGLAILGAGGGVFALRRRFV